MINKILRRGFLFFIVFILLEIVGNKFFEVRNEALHSVLEYSELVIFLAISITIILGLHKVQHNWKWFAILPLVAFSILYLSGTLFVSIFVSMPNEIRIKEDTEVIYRQKDNQNKKVVRQTYTTGITGDLFHSDTLFVNEFTSWIRIVRPFRNEELNNSWVKIPKP